MPKNEKTPMTPTDASRIQSHADRTDTNQDFKARAQSAAEKNSGSGNATGNSEGKCGAKQGK